MRRFDVTAAYVLGVLLPVLETMRRGTDFSTIAFYVDDYIAGGLLLWAAIAVRRHRPYGQSLLIGAWGVVCGGLYFSFFGQIEGQGPVDVSGLSKWTIVAIKGVIGAVAVCAWIRSMLVPANNSRKSLETD